MQRLRNDPAMRRVSSHGNTFSSPARQTLLGSVQIEPRGNHRGVTETVSGGASVSDLERLRAFAQEVMQAWPEGGIDGGDLQEIAEKHGLLIEKQMVAPCCESCNCADCGVSGPTL